MGQDSNSMRDQSVTPGAAAMGLIIHAPLPMEIESVESGPHWREHVVLVPIQVEQYLLLVRLIPVGEKSLNFFFEDCLGRGEPGIFRFLFSLTNAAP